MRSALRILLVAAAVGLIAARLLTGIVYEHDDPTTYLVLKHAPSLTIVQENTAAPVRGRFSVIDGDENQLVYQSGYVLAMRWSFAIAGLLVVAAMLARSRPAPL